MPTMEELLSQSKQQKLQAAETPPAVEKAKIALDEGEKLIAVRQKLKKK